MEKEEHFREFLQNLSDCYSGNQCKVLRFLLFDYLPIAKLSEAHPSGMSYFNELDVQGGISKSDVVLLSEIADLTNNRNAKLCVNEYQRGISHSKGTGTRLSQYRKTLYNCLIEMSEFNEGEVQSDLHRLIDSYRLGNLNFQNKWDLVFHLEKELKLSDSTDKLKHFENGLNTGMAKGIIHDYLKWIAAGDAEITLLKKQIEVESSDTEPSATEITEKKPTTEISKKQPKAEVKTEKSTIPDTPAADPCCQKCLLGSRVLFFLGFIVFLVLSIYYSVTDKDLNWPYIVVTAILAFLNVCSAVFDKKFRKNLQSALYPTMKLKDNHSQVYTCLKEIHIPIDIKLKCQTDPHSSIYSSKHY